jgi:hypothetical protein
MTGFEAYQNFLSLKQHFNHESYDYFRYNGKLRLNPSTFESKKDRFFFDKLAKKKDVIGYIVANLLVDNCNWIGDLFSDKAENNYTEWLKRKESLSYIFTGDISNLGDDFNKNLIVVDGQHPPLLKLLRQKKISLETVVILNDIVNFLPHWKKSIKDSVVWPNYYRKTLKYKPFLEYNKPKLKKLLKERFE